MRARHASTVLGAAVLTVALAGPAVAAETFYTNGTSTSGTCGTARHDGSSKLDDPRTAGISYAGAVSNWSASCNPPGAQGQQRCYWTTASLVSGGKVRSGLWYVPEGYTGSDPYGAAKTAWKAGTGNVDSLVVCSWQIDGYSHSPKAQGYKSDGSTFNYTVYS